ncbi:TRAP transporter small permease [Proteiniclasticum sp. SCR006]|uniref:TRAP transporter small permease n=1 Tax=Proteiniclasticum aestuarii TaxID=2817862 RepID=A0A939KI10_9CLOT|nr:TRAP transporter small permease [Proteiniclasticum aestuarii]MBO1266129.1 TRAP transporter small permease [Proteiniclasticum aestuarii]
MKESNLKKILNNIEEIIASGFIILTTVLVVINVFMRYFLKTGLYWSEEVATASFVWAVFIGAVAGYKKGKHIGVDILVNLLPASIQKVVVIMVDIVLILLNGYMTYLAVIFISLSYIKPTPVLGISSAYISSALLVSFTWVTIYSVIFLVRDIRRTDYSKGGDIL